MMLDYREVELSQGRVAFVSLADFESVNRWSWHFDGRYARGYPHGVKEYLHRYIMKPKKDQVVDHINGDRLDCRRRNMRNCDRYLNSSNKHGEPRNKYGMRGVYRVDDKRYRAEIHYRGKRYTLGTHPSPVEANAAYEEAKVLLQNGFDIIKKVGRRG